MAEQDLTLELVGQTQLFIGTRFILEIQCTDDKAIARRIVAAVNACKGIENPQLQIAAAMEIAHGLLSGVAPDRCQCDPIAESGEKDPLLVCDYCLARNAIGVKTARIK